MSGSGGASSTGYPDYIEGIHQLVMRGGTLKAGTSDGVVSASEFSPIYTQFNYFFPI